MLEEPDERSGCLAPPLHPRAGLVGIPSVIFHLSAAEYLISVLVLLLVAFPQEGALCISLYGVCISVRLAVASNFGPGLGLLAVVCRLKQGKEVHKWIGNFSDQPLRTNF